MSNQEFSVIIADDHKLIRELIREIIEDEINIKVIAEAGDGVEAVNLASELSPDVVIMDINMPRMNGIKATKEIVQRAGNVEIIGLSFNKDSKVKKEMLDAGAVAFLSKSNIKKLLPIIRNITQKDRCLKTT